MPGTAESPAAPDRAARLTALRAQLRGLGIDGFIVPRADAHLGEYVPPHAERLGWLTGFTGSAGIAIVLQDEAALFVDGRYTLQAREEVDAGSYSFCHLVESPPERWLEAHLAAGQVLGFDPWLHGERQLARLRAAVEKAGGELRALAENPIDAVWPEQPAPPQAPIVPHPLAYAGRASAEKRLEVAAVLQQKGAEAAVLTLPDSIAWLLNVRGGDVPHTPLPLSFALLHPDATVAWFVDPAKLTAELEQWLGNGVVRRPPEELGPALDALGAAGKRVLADPDASAAWVFDRLRTAGASILAEADPCQLPKARKNEVELAGTRAAHRRDGRAVARFLAWLHAAAGAGKLPSELEAAEQLLALRRENELFRDLSFSTISGAGPNGAIVHYRSSPRTNRRLQPGELYLVDSGAQYLDGTTDITRTIAIGTPSAEMRDRFTRVLKGHIALARARFPRGTSGSQLDALARYNLWQAGLDYDHGTGHGVGSYLGVHEGPQRIAKLASSVALEPGMILSNEPGYYKTGAYGIRIENLVAVVADAAAGPAVEREMLGFETLTLAPIDLNLVERALLSLEEVAWLDAYHARLRNAYGRELEPAAAAWLVEATRPLA